MVPYKITQCIALMIAFVLASSLDLQAKDRQAIAVSAEMKQAAIEFLGSLDHELLKQSKFKFDGPERTDWHFIPKDRVGVSFKEMTLVQRRAARVLMRSALTEKGYLKSVTIMSLEQVLRLLEADRENVNEIRDPEKYWFAVFGDPAADKPWGWRVEGHHLSLNFTSVGGVVAGSAPIFFGSNPAEVRVGPKIGLRVLGHEEDQARALMSALTAEQKTQAIIAPQAPKDVLTVPGQPIDIGAPAGLSAAAMTKRQRAMLRAMVVSFLRHLQPGIINQEIREIDESGIGKIYFAWMGSLDPTEKHYFRVHGPTFILEYDNAQGNHAHVVWHSQENDFGAAVLHRHYQESPHHHHQ